MDKSGIKFQIRLRFFDSVTVRTFINALNLFP